MNPIIRSAPPQRSIPFFVIVAPFVAMISGIAIAAQASDLPPNINTVCHLVGLGATCSTVDRQEFPHAGVILYRLKTRSADGSQQGRLCLDQGGAAIDDCGASLRKERAAIYWQDYGAISPDLWAVISVAAPNSKVPVGFILPTSFEAPDKSTASVAQLATGRWTRLAEIAEARSALMASAKKAGVAGIRALAGAPVAYADITPAQVMALAKALGIGRMVWAKPNVPQATNYVAAVGANSTGYTGANKTVCVIENHRYATPSYVSFEDTYCGTVPEYWDANDEGRHGRLVSGIINQGWSPYGTAPDSLLYYAYWDNCDQNAAPAMEWCIDQGAKVWNFSHTCSELDRWLFDYWTKASPYPLVVVAAGNEGPATVSCGNSCGTDTIGSTTCGAFNTLVVGGVNDCGTDSRSDDNIYCSTSSLNQGTDRELPHLAAPAQNITADGLLSSGTSLAAPNVTGIAAQLLEVNWSDIGNWPELSRAILIATADENVDGGRMTVLGSTTDHRDGAGEANALLATDLAANGTRRMAATLPVKKALTWPH